MTRAERDVVGLHLWFAALAAAVLAVPGSVPVGWRVFALVAGYNVALPVLAVARRHREWLRIWGFVLAVSALRVWPDWYLSDQLGVLAFADDGFPDLGTVTGYMAGLWVIPLFLVVVVGRSVESRQGRALAYAAVLIAAAAVFLPAEEFMRLLPAWRAQGVATWGNVAVYVIGPQLLLGLGTYYAYVQLRGRHALAQVPAAVVVMLLYFGAAVFAWFAIERVWLA